MIKNDVRWRKEFGIDGLLEVDLGNDLEKVVFMHGFAKERKVTLFAIMSMGSFQNKELYQKTFFDEEKRQEFLRCRIQFLEKGIGQLDFSPNGICTMVQVNDLKNSPGPEKHDLRIATNQALSILQDNYPEFVAKQFSKSKSQFSMVALVKRMILISALLMLLLRLQSSLQASILLNCKLLRHAFLFGSFESLDGM